MPSAHDYSRLIARWRAVGKRAGLRLKTFGTASEYPLYYLETPSSATTSGLYLSATIHGDEPAGAAALLAWAEALGPALRELPALIFPCLNPWGLVNNVRLDAQAQDLNRSFHLAEVPFVQSWRAILRERQFRLGLLLHEDYDGEGLYLYEVERRRSEMGLRLLEAAAPHLPIDQRRRIDKYRSRAGLIRRRLRMADFDEIGYPEAVWLHLHHCAHTYTVEAPSEFALEQRVAGLRAVLEAGTALL